MIIKYEYADMAELAVFVRARPYGRKSERQKGAAVDKEIRKYRGVGHRKSHAERGCKEN